MDSSIMQDDLNKKSTGLSQDRQTTFNVDTLLLPCCPVS